MLKKINHIGIAVSSLEKAIPFYGGILRMSFKGVEEVVGYRVRVAFFEVGQSKIELLEPMDEGSFLTAFLRENGSGIHHIAYEVEDLEATIQGLEAEGVKMIDRSPRPGAHGARVAFIDPESSKGILTELCQMGHTGEIISGAQGDASRENDVRGADSPAEWVEGYEKFRMGALANVMGDYLLSLESESIDHFTECPLDSFNKCNNECI